MLIELFVIAPNITIHIFHISEFARNKKIVNIIAFDCFEFKQHGSYIYF